VKNKLLQYVEMITGVSVVVTLIILIVEVRTNTQMVERQLLMDATMNVAAPFTSGPELPQAYERVKEVDGWETSIQAFMERYDMEPAQAIAWTRFLTLNWGRIEADYLTIGPSEQLAAQIKGLITFPDNVLFWDTRGRSFDAKFMDYVERLLSDESDPSR